MRYIVICGLLLLTACSGAPFSKSLSLHPQSQMQDQDQDPVQELFIAALEQYSTSNNLEPLEELVQQNPDTIWSVYAEKIIQSARKLEAFLTEANKSQTKSQQVLAELEAAKQENLHLSEKIEQLKKLLIELEQRPQ